ncbi:MAG: M20/M25/M40 family metallo-hydrolase [Planctomycetota bacterium]
MELLEKLTQTPGIPGREDRVRELILEEIDGLFDDVSVDPMGSVIAVRRATAGGADEGSDPAAPTRVMLAAHMDQIGFVVKHVGDDGFLRVHQVGGFDTRNLFARMVTVATEGGDLLGVMNPGSKPVHLASAEKRKKPPKVSDLLVDLGLPEDQVKERVKIGDMVTLRVPFQLVGNTAVGQCMDNRVACWIAIEAIRKLAAADTEHAAEVHCVFTVQEEVGLRGATTAAYTVRPDIGIGIDTTLCVDTPGSPEDQRCTVQGAGAALTVMDGASIGDPRLLADFERVAEAEGIATQRSVLPRGGTDTAGIQKAAGGTRAFTLSCPTRYIHTVVEMVHLDDLHACRDLLAAFLADVR